MSDWKMYDISNGHKTCDNLDKSSDEIFDVIKLLEKKFKITDIESPIVGLDTTIVEGRVNNEKIIFGWDIWSGIFIMSKTNDGDKIIEEIYLFLENM